MEVEKTKSYKEMDKLFNEFASHDNTLLALWKIGEQGGVAFTGDEFDVSRAFYEILKNGLHSRKEDTEFKLMSSLMFGIKMLVAEKSAESISFMGILNKIYNDVIDATVKKMSKKIKECEDESVPAPPVDFDLKSKDCQECEDFADCLVRAFIRQAEERVRQAEKHITIPTNGKGKVRKTKKANKKDEK